MTDNGQAAEIIDGQIPFQIVGTINKELLDWSKSALIPWQHEALRRLLTKGSLDDGDKQALFERAQFDLNVKETTKPLPNLNLTEADLPIPSNQATVVKLKSLRDLENVNALKVGQTLRFGPQLTIIYGENGSGKSGYARVLKRSSRCTEKAVEPILPDVYKHPQTGRR